VFTLNLAQQKQAQNIVNLTLGEGYIDIQKIKSSGYQKYDVFIVQHHRQVLGIAWVKFLSREDIIKKTRNKLSFSKLTAHIDVVAIHPKFQKKGIGNQLFKQIIKQNKHCKMLCFAWDNQGKVHLNKLLTRNNFKEIIGFKNYYLKDSLTLGFNCSVCGFPCKCGIKIYRKGF
jgi:ribosomal protein S18 acetylase RimI-like enzyme